MELFPAIRAVEVPTPGTSRGAAHAEDFPEVHPPQPERQLPPPSTLIGGTTEVEFSRHSSGVPQVRFYDKHSGAVMDTFPFESVLNKVSALMDFVRKTV